MPTPAILNTSSAVPSQKQGTKQTAGGAADGAFNQMLSQQIADRRSAGNVEQARAANKPNEAAKAKDKPAADKAGNNANTAPTDKDKSAGAAKGSDEAAKTRSAAAADDKNAVAVTADTSTVPPSATELLALAASGLLNPQTTSANTTVAAAVTSVPTLTAGITASADAAVLSANERLLTAMDNSVTQTQTDPADSSTDFKALLDQAGEQPATGSSAAAQARDASTGLPQAISVADGKGLERLTELSATAKMQDSPAVTGAVPQLQQNGVDVIQAATGKTTDRLTPHVGTPAWDQALGQKVVWMVAGAQQSASLTLNPPDLGPLQVVLNVSNGHADASFYAAQPEVRQALEAALPKLRDMMSNAGVELGQTTVSAGMPDQHNQPGESAPRQASRGAGHDKSSNDAAAPVARTQSLSGGLGLVDTFA